jgi:hypothetical protein
VVARFGLRAEAIRWAARPSYLELPSELAPEDRDGPMSIAGVGRGDLVHLRASQLRGTRRGDLVVFLTWDEKLYAAKPEVEQSLPAVRLTTPEYLSLYLGT